MDVAAANERALAGLISCRPRLVAVKPALEVVPGMRPELMLHAAPPTTWSDLAPPLEAALAGAAEFEGLQPEGVALAAAQDHGSMAGGAGAITASTPVVVIEDQASGRRAFHFLMEGFGRTLILGMTGNDVFDRLRWLRDEVAPALDVALENLGGIDCDEIIVEALNRGDELHNRNAAATSMLAERLAVGLAQAGVSAEAQARLFAFLRDNPQFCRRVARVDQADAGRGPRSRGFIAHHRGRRQRPRRRDQGLGLGRALVQRCRGAATRAAERGLHRRRRGAGVR